MFGFRRNRLLKSIDRKVTIIMADVASLTSAVAAVQSDIALLGGDVSAAINLLNQLKLLASGGTSIQPADLDPVLKSLQLLHGTLSSMTGSLEAAVTSDTPLAPPAPAPLVSSSSSSSSGSVSAGTSDASSSSGSTISGGTVTS